MKGKGTPYTKAHPVPRVRRMSGRTILELRTFRIEYVDSICPRCLLADALWCRGYACEDKGTDFFWKRKMQWSFCDGAGYGRMIEGHTFKTEMQSWEHDVAEGREEVSQICGLPFSLLVVNRSPKIWATVFFVRSQPFPDFWTAVFLACSQPFPENLSRRFPNLWTAARTDNLSPLNIIICHRYPL